MFPDRKVVEKNQMKHNKLKCIINNRTGPYAQGTLKDVIRDVE